MFAQIGLGENGGVQKDHGLQEGLQKTHTLNNQEREARQWQWHQCHFIIREITDGQMVFRSLKPSVELVSLNTTKQPVKIDLKVQMDRDFQFSKDAGWTWHKSWIIPTIQVSVILPKSYKSKAILPQNSYFQIRVVKASCKNPDKLFLIDMGVEGINVIPACSGTGLFQGLKFIQTSYKNQGTKFSLIISLKYNESGNCHPQVISSIISPPVFIDSRRTARNTHLKMVALRPQSYLQQFNPARFSEVLVKRLKQSQVQITNSLEGMLNYLTSPNIRNKIKNPFFFCIRFNKELNLYYNRLHIQKQQNLIHVYMKKSRQIVFEDKMKSKKQRKNKQGITSKTFIAITINGDEQMIKEVIHKLQLNSIISIISMKQSQSLLNQNFVHITSSKLTSLYQDYYVSGQIQSEQSEIHLHKQQQEQLFLRPIISRPTGPQTNKQDSHSVSYKPFSSLFSYNKIQIICNNNSKEEEYLGKKNKRIH